MEILPGAVFAPARFLVSVLCYTPAARFVCLAFSRSEAIAQARFLRHAGRPGTVGVTSAGS